jgi:hypothetical protein
MNSIRLPELFSYMATRHAALHRQWPNPSVKGTPTSGLRPLAAAPYLER